MSADEIDLAALAAYIEEHSPVAAVWTLTPHLSEEAIQALADMSLVKLEARLCGGKKAKAANAESIHAAVSEHLCQPARSTPHYYAWENRWQSNVEYLTPRQITVLWSFYDPEAEA